MSNREIAAIRNAASEARRHYRVRERLGVSPSAGHARGVLALYIVMALCAAAYAFAFWRGI
jgi:hypothetical protein